MFPFQPTHNAPDNITNVRTWAGADHRPAGEQGFIAVLGDRFVDGQNNEIRFLGTQCGMTGCFPSHEQADRLAREFTRYGINVIRMHYVSHRTPVNGYPVLNSFIEPVQLERFDYFISKLKENGIYVYFQLNIARKFGRVNGFENAHLLPKYKNGVDNVNERMIELQKQFHKEIMEHVNQYTCLSYNDETCISMMELANENSIIHAWFSKTHRFTALVEPYKSDFIRRWNEWLVKKYGTTEHLKRAWFDPSKGDGSELMANANKDTFDDARWDIQTAPGARADWYLRKASKRDGLSHPRHVRLSVESVTGDEADPRLYYQGINLMEDKSYCLKFKIRSDVPMSVQVRIAQNHAPWKEAGLKTTVKSDSGWSEYKFNFTSTLNDADVRLVMNNFKPGTVDVADVSLTAGIDYQWPSHQSLEAGNVDWPYVYNWSAMRQRSVDFIDFLSELEMKYFTGLYNHTKNTLGIRQPVTGTQLGYGFNQAQAGMDYCDNHCYWCHPAFPGGKWDNDHFNVRNDAIINSWGHPASTFTKMARSRILGKPFTVSEFDIPNLNFYAAEANVMMAALGAYQNWSGLIQFSWILDTDYDRTYIWPQFDMCSAPQKLVHFPACYAMFVRGDVKKGKDDLVFAHPSRLQKDVRAVAVRQLPDGHAIHDSQLLNSLPLAMVSGVQVEEEPALYSTEGKKVIRTERDVPEHIRDAFSSKNMKSSTGEITWNWQEPGAGYFMVDTRNTKVFSGFVRKRSFTYRGMTLRPARNRLDWLTLSLTLAEAFDQARPGNLLRPGRYLLAATGLVQNTDMKIVSVSENPQKLSISRPDGGRLGTAPILCEGIAAEISFSGLKNRVRCYALDPDGAPFQEVPVGANAAGEALLKIGPQYRTVWYELIIEKDNNAR
ncbi:MAG: hypothetical protein J6T35_05155 [Bacteroidales bacterium]|nr:hypothetical protein [Bacteroidales bacterium]